MLYGGHIKSLDHIDILRGLRFDFGEVILKDADSRKFWRDSGISNRFDDGFFMIAHGPFEGPPNDAGNLWEYYLPALKESVDTALAMEMEFLTVHLYTDRRFVKPELVEEKLKALEELVQYGKENRVEIALENLSEPAADLARALDAAPGLSLTLDVGHGELLTETNTSVEIIEALGDFIRHVHLHDNRGGKGPKDDLHLPIGDGIVDFPAILEALIRSGYGRTMTLELKPEELQESRERVMEIVEST